MYSALLVIAGYPVQIVINSKKISRQKLKRRWEVVGCVWQKEI
jgi:hypothetical protein